MSILIISERKKFYEFVLKKS